MARRDTNAPARQTTHPRRKARQVAAAARQAHWDLLTTAEKLDRVESRGFFASREHDRLHLARDDDFGVPPFLGRAGSHDG